MNNATTITISNHPNTNPVLVDTRWFDRCGKAYVFPCADGDGFQSYSASDGAFLCWSQTLADAPVDASLAEMDRAEAAA